VFLSQKTSKENLRKIFLVAWREHKIYDILVAFENEFIEKESSMTIYAYNTFDENSDDQLIEFEFSRYSSDEYYKLQSFVQDRQQNLKGFTLRVVLFKFMMVCDGEEDEHGNFRKETLKFQDSETLKILSKVANFTIKFVKSSDGILHGYQLSNDTFTGSFGMVEYENADYMANARLVADYNTSNTLCLFLTTSTKLKFSVPRKLWSDVNILVSFYNFLDDSLKISILVMFVVIPLLIQWLDHISLADRCSFESLARNYLMLFSIITFVSIKLPRYWPTRFITGAVVLAWLVIGNTYAGKMIEFLNTSLGLKQIGSIDELTRTSLEVKVPYPMAILFEGDLGEATQSHLYLNKVIKKSRILERAENPKAFVDVHNMGEMIRSKKYSILFFDFIISFLEKSYYDDYGNDFMTHIKETPYEYFYATSVPKTSPFVGRFNEILMRIFEAGISKYQMNKAISETDLIYIRRMKIGKIDLNGLKSISLTQLSSIIYLFFISLVITFLVFLCEILINVIAKCGKIN
jgi:hypothetical protein